MKFAAIIQYTPDRDKTAAVRPAHREYLKQVFESGRLAISGPFTDDSGGILVYEADTPEEAESLLRNDPFAKHGVFSSWTIREWKVVMANPDLCRV